MAGREDLIELKFRLADGTDIGPTKYGPATTVATLKEKIIAQWPKENESAPKTIAELKLISAGRILENNTTISEATLPLGDLPGGAITMHVVHRTPMLDKKSEKLQSDSSKTPACACTIL